MAKKALYLAGGGARGAYQAGVLKAIEKILQVKINYSNNSSQYGQVPCSSDSYIIEQLI